MSSLVWTENCRPDRPGIWAMRNANGSASIREVTDPESWVFGTWCFLMDLPEIKDPPKYREVTAADVGKTVEGRYGSREWKRGYKLAGFFNGKAAIQTGPNAFSTLDEARILDDGEPAKQPDPELKLGRSYTYDGKKYSLVAWRWDHKQPDEHIGVFEVIDESAS